MGTSAEPDRQTEGQLDIQRDRRSKDDENSSRPFDVGLGGALRGEDEAVLLREGDFQRCSRPPLTPRASASSVGFKNTRFYSETTQIYSGLQSSACAKAEKKHELMHLDPVFNVFLQQQQLKLQV